MYTINEGKKKFLGRVVYVVFEPKTQWEIDNKVINRCKHSIKLFRRKSNFSTTLGEFDMTAIIGDELELENLEFGVEYEPKAKIYFCHMIVEEAIEQAQHICADRLVIETLDPMFVEAFLEYGFKIRTLVFITSRKTVYRATKEIEEKELLEKAVNNE